MTQTLEYTGRLVITTCWCGLAQAIPSDLMRMAEQTGKAVWCPLGHEWVVKETELDRTKKRLEAAERQVRIAQNQRDGWRLEAEDAERSRRAYKGHLTRIRNKVANGVCPVAGCRRHFDNVQAHIATQHPDWAVIDPETGKAAKL